MLTIAIWTHTKSETIYHHDELIKENFWALLGAIYYHCPGGGVCLNFILLGGAFSTEKKVYWPWHIINSLNMFPHVTH